MSFTPSHPDAPNIYPSVTYHNAKAAIEFLEKAFAFERVAVYEDDNGRIAHAELHLGPGIVMMGEHKGDEPITAQSIYIAISDVDAHHDRAKAAGAEIIRELHDTDYGSRDYAAKDQAGHTWHFGTYQPVANAAS